MQVAQAPQKTSQSQRRSGPPGTKPRIPQQSWLKRVRDNWVFYINIAPFFILFGIFGALPIIATLFYSFTQWDGLSQPIFVGANNYMALLKSPDFLQVIYNTVYIWFFSTILTLALAFILAFLVNYYVRVARTFFRVVFLFPLLVAPALTSILISVLFSTNAGLLNTVIGFLIGHEFQYNWFSSGVWLKPMIILMIIWRWTGWHFILFLAGLQTIPTEIHEAARVDGAKGWQIFRSVTIPLMVPVVLVSAVTATIGGLQIFDESYVLTNGTGGTLQAATTLGLYQYQAAFQQFNFGLASAISYVMFAFILVFSLLNFFVARRHV